MAMQISIDSFINLQNNYDTATQLMEYIQVSYNDLIEMSNLDNDISKNLKKHMQDRNIIRTLNAFKTYLKEFNTEMNQIHVLPPSAKISNEIIAEEKRIHTKLDNFFNQNIVKLSHDLNTLEKYTLELLKNVYPLNDEV